MQSIVQVVQRLGHKYRLKTEENLMRLGGKDRRKEPFKGSIEIEYFKWEADNIVHEGSRCVMKRDKVSGLLPLPTLMLMIFVGIQGSPTEWRRLWKDIASAPEVAPFVLRTR